MLQKIVSSRINNFYRQGRRGRKEEKKNMDSDIEMNELYPVEEPCEIGHDKAEGYRKWFVDLTCVSGLVVVLSTYTLLITVSSDGTGNYRFFLTTVTLSSELLKLLLSLLLYVVTIRDSDTPLCLTLRKSLHFSVPAAVYCVNNNLLFLILVVIDPSTFQLLSNLNVIFVGLFSVLLIRIRLDVVRWMSILILFSGTLLTQLQCDAVMTRRKTLALLLTTLYAALDALGSVYTERRFKMDSGDSIYVQNIHVFFYGTIANAILFFVYDFKHVLHSGLFYGYTWLTPIIIISLTLAGMLGNVIMKRDSTIARAFCVSISMLLTTLMAHLFMSFRPSLLFVASALIVICSVILYRYTDVLGFQSQNQYTDHDRLYERAARVQVLNHEDPFTAASLDYDVQQIERDTAGKED